MSSADKENLPDRAASPSSSSTYSIHSFDFDKFLSNGFEKSQDASEAMEIDEEKKDNDSDEEMEDDVEIERKEGKGHESEGVGNNI